DVAATAGKLHRRRDDQRDPLVGRAEEDVEAAAEVPLDRVRIRRGERRELRSGTIFAGVDEIGRAPAAFRHEITEREDVRADHELDELGFVSLHRSGRDYSGDRRGTLTRTSARATTDRKAACPCSAAS